MRTILLVAALLFVFAPAPVTAQTTLTSVTFTASADHTATMADGTPILTRYELVIDRLASTVPPNTAVNGLATLNLGKPTPAGGVISLLNVPVPVALTAGDYVGRLAAVGPGGRSADLSGPFSQPASPRPATGPLSIVR